jgi:hypothetical protein
MGRGVKKCCNQQPQSRVRYPTLGQENNGHPPKQFIEESVLSLLLSNASNSFLPALFVITSTRFADGEAIGWNAKKCERLRQPLVRR